MGFWSFFKIDNIFPFANPKKFLDTHKDFGAIALPLRGYLR